MKRALAHMGETALTLARRFGELELAELERSDVAYVSSPFGCALDGSGADGGRPSLSPCSSSL